MTTDERAEADRARRDDAVDLLLELQVALNRRSQEIGKQTRAMLDAAGTGALEGGDRIEFYRLSGVRDGLHDAQMMLLDPIDELRGAGDRTGGGR